MGKDEGEASFEDVELGYKVSEPASIFGDTFSSGSSLMIDDAIGITV